jgi:hypothetical protein
MVISRNYEHYSINYFFIFGMNKKDFLLFIDNLYYESYKRDKKRRFIEHQLIKKIYKYLR